MVFNVSGEGFGILPAGVAGHHRLEPAEPGAVQFRQAVKVPVPHAAATDQPQSDF